MDGPQASASSGPSICEALKCGASIVPLFVGVLVSSILLGVIIVLSVAAYWGRSWLTKATIAVVVGLQTVQTAVDMARLTLKFALNFGDVAFVLRTLSYDGIAPFLGVILQVQAQVYMLGRARHFARLAYPFPGRDLVAAGLVMVILASAACGCATAIWTVTLGNFAELVPGSTAPNYYTVSLQLWLASSAGVDCILAAIVTHELAYGRKWSSKQSATAVWVRAIARRLAVVVVQSGLLLAAAQLAAVALWRLEMRNDNRDGAAYVFFPLTILPKLYTLTYLVLVLCTPPPLALQDQAATTSPTSAHTDTAVTIDTKAFGSSSVPRSARPPAGRTSESTQRTEPARSTTADPSEHDTSFIWSVPRLARPRTAWSVRSRGRAASDSAATTAGLQSELDYYRDYSAALDAARAERRRSASGDVWPHAVGPSVPRIEHPYAVPRGAAEPTSTLASEPSRSASTIVSFEIDGDLSGDSFGTLQAKREVRVQWSGDADGPRLRDEFAKHARRFMQAAAP